MKRNFIAFFILTVCTGLFFTKASAQPIFKVDPKATKIIITQQFLADYANKLESRLKNKSVGYQFTVISNNVLPVSRAGGDARRAPDANPRKMSADDKFNIASVSKTITAAAVMKLLNQQKISVDTPVHTYLPENWTFGTNFKTVTFRELLTHRSGLRCAKEVTYTNLKECVAGGVQLADKNTQKYNNSNFALFRMVIPRLAGFSDANLVGDAAKSAGYAGFYKSYVQRNVLMPFGLNGVDLKPITDNPALAYQYPSPVIAGDSFGDMTETSASRGWNMNSKQLAAFINGLLYTEKIVPKTVSDQMKKDQLGLWQSMNGTNVVDYEHGGYYPGKNDQGGLYNQGEMNTLIAAFPNGVSVAVIVNSQFGPGQSVADAARQAMSEMTK